jgi:streptogramin lyase
MGTTATALPVTLTNSGSAALALSGVAITGANTGVFAIASNTCGSSLSAGAQCAVSISFTPSSVASFSASLTLTDNAAGSPQAVSLIGTGTIVPTLTFAPTSLVFPNTAPNLTAAAMTATLSNSSSSPLALSSVALTGTNASAFAITANTCGSSIAATGQCTVSITFKPTAVASYTANLSVTDNGTGSPQTLPLSGAGVQPMVTVSPSSLNFGTNLDGSSQQLTVTITNTSNVATTLNGAAVSGTAASNFAVSALNAVYSPTITACAVTLPALTACYLTVTFNPTAPVSDSATLTLTDNALTSPQTVSLAGSGAVEPSSCTTQNTTSPAQTPPTANYAGTAFTGKVMAGATPVIGASVQIYAAGQAGNGSAPTALLTTPLTTSSTGAFSVPATFTCPYNNSVLFAVARGGQAGTGGAVNAGTVLAGVLGLCNSITGSPVFTINEVTTAAMAWSMQQFMALGGKMGATATNSSGSTNSAGIVLAAGTFANLVNNLTGTSPGTYFPGTGTAPTAKIDQVANLLNACSVSTGATSSACTQLYTLTTTSAGTPTNTLDAALNLVRNPGANVAALYTLSAGSSAFSPVLTAAPTDWTLFVTYSGGGMNDPSALSIDSKGRIWVANYVQVASLFTNTGTPVFANGITGNYLFNSYGGGVDVNDVEWVVNEESNGFNGGLGSITLLNSSGGSPAIYQSGGINFPLGISFDTQGNAWIADYGDISVTVLNNTGTSLAGASGFSTGEYGFPVAVATDAKCNVWVANQATSQITFTSASGTIFGDFTLGGGPSGLSVDASGYVWSANYYGDSVGLLSPTGTILSGASGFTGGGVERPQGIAADGAGNIWVANFRAPGLSELAAASASTPGAALSPTTGWAPDAGLLEAFALAIDAGGNVWVSNFGSNTITEFVGLAVPVKTPLLGPVRVP